MEQDQMPVVRQEIRALTSLRMIAALLVFLHHCYYTYVIEHLGIFAGIVRQGHIGVTIFFVLSGFLITMRYYPKFDSAGFRGRRLVFDYFRKRFARIYPLYFSVWFLRS